jgi:hypothetical protein
MRRIGSNVAAGIAVRDGRHHLAIAALLCALELVLIIRVEILIIHILMAVAMFGREVIDGAFARVDR